MKREHEFGFRQAMIEWPWGFLDRDGYITRSKVQEHGKRGQNWMQSFKEPWAWSWKWIRKNRKSTENEKTDYSTSEM